jgi:hypothetical protein
MDHTIKVQILSNILKANKKAVHEKADGCLILLKYLNNNTIESIYNMIKPVIEAMVKRVEEL